MNKRELQDKILELGGNPESAGVTRRVETARQAATARFERDSTSPRANLYRALTALKEGLFKALAYMVVFTIACIIVVGIPTLFVLTLLAEYTAVREGIATLTPGTASLYSAATLVLILLIMFIIMFLHDIGQVEHERKRRTTLRDVWERVQYFFGFRDDDHLRYSTYTGHLQMAYNVLYLLISASVLFSVLGRILPKLAGENNPWWQQIVSIVVDSTLLDLMQYVGTGVLTFGILLGLHLIMYFVYYLFAQLTGGFTFQTDSFLDISAGVEAAEIEVLMNEVKRLELKATNSSD